MKTLACLPAILAALWLGSPSTGLSKDHDHGHDNDHGHNDHGHGNWNGGNGNWHGNNGHGHYYYGGSRVRYYGYGGYSPYYYSYSPYYSAPYYGSYYASPSIGLSFSTSPTYRASQAGDGLAVDVQRALRRDGYYRGGIDGDIGAGTRSAIRQYQYDHRLEVTGRIDRSLLRALDLD
ncbi:MAG TPA: peptidoglycan-binding domain-containing protein [Chthoniobacter sp.]|nr:peptidoglycan-binding domain-containing protein [Chthoniobacter sp.]